MYIWHFDDVSLLVFDIYIILCLFKYHFVPYSSPWWKLLRIWSKCLKILPWFSSSLTIFDLDFLKYTYILVIFGTDVKFNIKFECECFWKVICEIIKFILTFYLLYFNEFQIKVCLWHKKLNTTKLPCAYEYYSHFYGSHFSTTFV